MSSFECSKDRISNSHLTLHSFPVFYFVSVAAVYNNSSCILPFFAGKCCMLNKIFYKIFLRWVMTWTLKRICLEVELWEMPSFMRFSTRCVFSLWCWRLYNPHIDCFGVWGEICGFFCWVFFFLDFGFFLPPNLVTPELNEWKGFPGRSHVQVR